MIYLHHLTIKWKLLLMGIHTISQRRWVPEVETLHGGVFQDSCRVNLF